MIIMPLTVSRILMKHATLPEDQLSYSLNIRLVLRIFFSFYRVRNDKYITPE